MSTEPPSPTGPSAELATLRQALAERDDLAALVGHELRNPLHGLSLQLALARVTAQVHGQAESEERIAKAQTMLARYAERIGVLLDLFRHAGSAYPVAARPVDLSLLVGSLLDSLAPEAQHWGVVLELNAPPALQAVTDALAVEQILQNLVLNAFKHAGCKRVAVSLTQDGGDARIAVADDGRGIAEADRELVFRKFGMANDAARGNGSGLGLWIVRTLLAVLGGSVQLESAPGAGSTFTVQFPLHHQPAPMP